MKILICNGAHLGDVLLSAAIIRPLLSAFPGAKLGFLCASWSRQLLAGNQDITWIHEVDHWFLDRSAKGILDKARSYWRTRKTALLELRKVGYDMALDLYTLFPNSALLLWQAHIPVRAGYSSAGFGPLYTHPKPWQNKDQSIADYYQDLLEVLAGPGNWRSSALASSLRRPSPEQRGPKLGPFLQERIRGRDYLLFHVAAGNPVKEWPEKNWAALIRRLQRLDLPIIFTGTGSRESKIVEHLVNGVPYCHSACGVLDWPGFVAAIAGAKMAVTADSVAAHVAAAVDVPCVVIGNGILSPRYWHPLSDKATVLKHPTPCSPCYRSKGCEEMDCVRRVEVDVVESKILSVLSGRTT